MVSLAARVLDKTEKLQFRHGACKACLHQIGRGRMGQLGSSLACLARGYVLLSLGSFFIVAIHYT